MAVQAFQVRGPGDLDNAFSAIAKERADALIVVPDLMFNEHRKQIVDLAAKHRLPATYFSKDFVDAGGLILCVELYRPIPALCLFHGQIGWFGSP